MHISPSVGIHAQARFSVVRSVLRASVSVRRTAPVVSSPRATSGENVAMPRPEKASQAAKGGQAQRRVFQSMGLDPIQSKEAGPSPLIEARLGRSEVERYDAMCEFKIRPWGCYNAQPHDVCYFFLAGC